MDKDKLIELLKDAWSDGMSQYHDCKLHHQYKEDLDNYLSNAEDEINELCAVQKQIETTAEAQKSVFLLP